MKLSRSLNMMFEVALQASMYLPSGNIGYYYKLDDKTLHLWKDLHWRMGALYANSESIYLLPELGTAKFNPTHILITLTQVQSNVVGYL